MRYDDGVLRAASCFVAVVACASPAQAVTALLPIDVAGADEEAAAVAIDAAFAAVLHDDLKRIAPGHDPGRDLARCHQNLSCLQRVAASADEVAWVSFDHDGAGGALTVKLALFAPDGAPLATWVRSFDSDDDARALAAAAFAPASFVGRVAFFGVGSDDVVMIDGVRSGAKDAGSFVVRAGAHVARVDRVDGSTDEVSFDVPFGGIARVAVPSSSSSVSLPPQVVGFTSGAFAVAGAAGVVWMLAREFVWADAAAGLAGVCGTTDEDPTGNRYANQGVDSLGICAAPHIEDRQWVQLNRDLHLPLGIGFAGVAVAGGAAAALSFALADPQPE